LRRLASIPLLVVFLALGTGTLQFLHNLDHQHFDAHRTAATERERLPSHPAPLPDDNNCATHAQLHQPVSTIAWVPLLVFLGLFVAFLTQLTPDPVSHRSPLALDCRGPPAC
jgi:hypothetical protein